MESALSYHGWIPEAVYVCACSSVKKSRVFDTPIGRFEYTKVPQEIFYKDVLRVKEDEQNISFIATPAKALCDYIYTKFLSWKISDAIVSLRIEPDIIFSVKKSELEDLYDNYKSGRVKRFLKSWIEYIKEQKK